MRRDPAKKVAAAVALIELLNMDMNIAVLEGKRKLDITWQQTYYFFKQTLLDLRRE